VNGVATLTNMTLDKWGENGRPARTPRTNGGPVDDGVSAPITVTASKLVVVSTPIAIRSGTQVPAVASAFFTTVVDAEDVTGDIAKNFAGAVTLSINSATQTVINDILGSAVLGGGNPVNAVNGVATLTNMTLDKWG